VGTQTAVIAGVAGQDGAYLAQQLIADGFNVYGLGRSISPTSTLRLKKLNLQGSKLLKLLTVDIAEPENIEKLIQEIRPTEFYNLASHSSVIASGERPFLTTATSALAPINFLESLAKYSPETRYFQAGSSEMFGNALAAPQNEDSQMAPRSLYGAAKLFAHWATIDYRVSKGLFASSGILYNHESPLRSQEFVTRKIASSVAQIKFGRLDQIQLGNLAATRDWGYAPEYVDAMRKVLAHSKPETFVIASGRSTTVRQFLTWAFEAAGMEVRFEGAGLQEVGFEVGSGRQIVSVAEEHFRPTEAIGLVGDPAKALRELNWEAQTPVKEIIRMMVDNDIAEAKEMK
jgi:GDPmannose 4,6-dehydratase